MKTVCSVTPIHGRRHMTVETISRFVERNKDYNIIPIVLGDDSNYKTMNDLGDVISKFCFVEMPNLPVWKKVERGIKKAQEFNADAVFHVGTDDWYSDNWIDRGFEYLESGKHFVAGEKINSIVYKDKDFKLFRTGPLHFHSGEMEGKTALDEINWDINDRSRNDKFTGRGAIDALTALGYKRIRMSDVEILCIDAGWETLNGNSSFVGTHGASPVTDLKSWLMHWFPDFYIRMEKVLIKMGEV